jgi:outer membrane protein OmpA-like peptidoglycan-associated protein
MVRRTNSDAAGLRRLVSAAAVGGALCASAPAWAQEGFALSRFEPSFAGDPLFGVASPHVTGDRELHVMALLDYAHDPLVLRGVVSGKNLGSIVSDQVLFHLDATYALWHRLALNLDLPVTFQRGDKPSYGTLSFGQPSAAGLGDLRVGLRAAILGDPSDPFQLGLGAMVWLPTGTRSAFASDGFVRGEPQVILGGVATHLVWSVAAGPELRATRQFVNVAPGSGFRWGVGVGFLPGDGTFQIGPEATGGVTFTDAARRTVNAELLVGTRYRFAHDFVVGFGSGVGLGTGAGTPDFRSVASIAYTPTTVVEAPPLLDRDGDGIPDTEDACPDEVGPHSADRTKNGCPLKSDRDGDGIPDAEDACPDVPGVRDVVPRLNGCPLDRDNDAIPDPQDACPEVMGEADPDPKKNGCPKPADRDGDGIPDAVDACPDVQGAADPDPKRNGCPGDRDGDGIYDDKDACPDEKGPPDPDPEKNGCPKDVRVTEGSIVILQQVEFDTGKATIRPVSNTLLDTVAGVLREHGEILKVEVGGHTDNRGSNEQNTVLSQQRADAVVAALVRRGIAAARLTAKGYGPSRPIMANLTTVGRQKNRRVEFRILERGARPAPKKP